MNPFMTRNIDGTYFCHGCNLHLADNKGAETHGTHYHRIPPDYLPQDDRGDFFDLRGRDLPKVLREGGVL